MLLTASRFLPFLMRFALLFLCSASIFLARAQNGSKLSNGIGAQECDQCRATIESRPKEVLFGIHFNSGDVYFSMSNEQWFNKVFSQPGDGILADLVSKD